MPNRRSFPAASLSQPAKPAEPNPVTVAMEALLRKELAVLSERLNRATGECATLRGERDELYQVWTAG